MASSQLAAPWKAQGRSICKRLRKHTRSGTAREESKVSILFNSIIASPAADRLLPGQRCLFSRQVRPGERLAGELSLGDRLIGGCQSG